MLCLPQGSVYPSLDGTLLLHQLADFHLHYNPSHPFYVYIDEDEVIHEVSHLEFARAAHRAAYSVDHLSRGTPVALVALIDTVLYHALVMGLMKAGYVVSKLIYLTVASLTYAVAISYLVSKLGSGHSETPS